MRITERGTKGDRSTIIVPSAGIPWFVQLFSYYASSAEGGCDFGHCLVWKSLFCLVMAYIFPSPGQAASDKGAFNRDEDFLF